MDTHRDPPENGDAAGAGAMDAWWRPAEAMLSRCERRGGFLVSLPEYRPDLLQELGEALALDCRDFRAEVMAPLMWDAAQLGLEDLDRWLTASAARGGLIAQNVEALLVLKRPEEREDWLSRFADLVWPAPVVVPLVLFCDEAPKPHGRHWTVAPDDVPEQSFVNRLLF